MGDHSKVVSINKSGNEEGLARMPAPLRNLRDAGLKSLGKLLQNLFDNADDALYELADKADTNAEQNLYFESMREVRIRRRSIEALFTQSLNKGFALLMAPEKSSDATVASITPSSAPDNLSLLNHDDLEERVAADAMVTRANTSYGDASSRVCFGLSKILDRNIPERENPLSPYWVVESFLFGTNDLGINIKAKLVILKLFDRFVMRELAVLYKASLKQLKADDVFPSASADNTPGQAQAAQPQEEEASFFCDLVDDNFDWSGGQSQSFSADTAGGAMAPAAPAGNAAAPAAGQQAVGDSGMLAMLRGLLAGRSQGATPGGGMPGGNMGAMVRNPGQGMAPSLGGGYAQGGMVGGAAGATGGAMSMGGGAVGGTPIPSQVLLGMLSQLQVKEQQQPLNSLPANVGQIGQDLVRMVQSGPVTKNQAVGQLDQDVIRLVDMLFQFILDDDALAAPMKALISRLQIPFLKAAMVDHDVFANGGHPARKLLNELAHAALGWEDSGKGDKDPLFRKVSGIVQNVLLDFDEDSTIFEDLLCDFKVFRESEERRAQLLQQRTLDAEQGRSRYEAAREKVDALIKKKLQEHQPVVASVETLLVDAWSNVLFMISLKQGEDCDDWRDAVTLVDELLWSAEPLEDNESRKRLLKLVPDLLHRLRKGLEGIAFDPFEMGRLFNELENLHIANMQRKLTRPVISEAQDNASEIAASNDGVAADATATPDVAEEQAAKQPSANDAYMKQVESLAMGAWVEFSLPGQEPFRSRLAAIIKHSGKYIFVNRSGMKVAEKTQNELALEMQQDRIRVLSDAQLFDRALESVITSLRTTTTH